MTRDPKHQRRLDRRWLRRAEDRAYNQQVDLIIAEHGPEEADRANYGWFSGEMPEGVLEITTKCYVEHANRVLHTICNMYDRTITHHWSS